MIPTNAIVLGLAILTAGAADAQDRRVQAPRPAPPPGVQARDVSPGSQAMSALSLKIDALRESVGRQVVVLPFEPTDLNSWPESQNNFPMNEKRAEDWCKEALADRYGRVLSRRAHPIMPDGDRWYFPFILCETKP